MASITETIPDVGHAKSRASEMAALPAGLDRPMRILARMRIEQNIIAVLLSAITLAVGAAPLITVMNGTLRLPGEMEYPLSMFVAIMACMMLLGSTDLAVVAAVWRRTRMLPAIRRIRPDNITPAAALVLAGAASANIIPALHNSGYLEAMRSVGDEATSEAERHRQRAPIIETAREVLRSKRCGVAALQAASEYSDYPGPLSDVMPLIGLPWKDHGEVRRAEQQVREKLNAATGGSLPILARLVSLPLSEAAGRRRDLLTAMLVREAESPRAEQILAGAAWRMHEKLLRLDPQQLDILDNLLATGWDGTADSALDAAAEL